MRQARARSISQTSAHIFIAAVCARGGAAAEWIEKVSECRETAGVGRGARCSFSDRAAGGVSAERREAGYCCGVRAASLGVCVHMVLYAVCAGRLAVCAAERMSVRACAVPDLRRTRGASWCRLVRCQKQCAEPAQGAKRRRCAGEVCCGARVAA